MKHLFVYFLLTTISFSQRYNFETKQFNENQHFLYLVTNSLENDDVFKKIEFKNFFSQYIINIKNEIINGKEVYTLRINMGIHPRRINAAPQFEKMWNNKYDFTYHIDSQTLSPIDFKLKMNNNGLYADDYITTISDKIMDVMNITFNKTNIKLSRQLRSGKSDQKEFNIDENKEFKIFRMHHPDFYRLFLFTHFRKELAGKDLEIYDMLDDGKTSSVNLEIEETEEIQYKLNTRDLVKVKNAKHYSGNISGVLGSIFNVNEDYWFNDTDSNSVLIKAIMDKDISKLTWYYLKTMNTNELKIYKNGK